MGMSESVGLCASCKRARAMGSHRDSVFYLCTLSEVDPRLRSIPRCRWWCVLGVLAGRRLSLKFKRPAEEGPAVADSFHVFSCSRHVWVAEAGNLRPAPNRSCLVSGTAGVIPRRSDRQGNQCGWGEGEVNQTVLSFCSGGVPVVAAYLTHLAVLSTHPD
jgi:hypothetical protein